ncbi:MAG: choice-of-anchor J domain-containing protein, partial [Bacteroidales bacterium]|nr:choice-of-anchor J domain-containing protein [Bacteroidales bacterium]
MKKSIFYFCFVACLGLLFNLQVSAQNLVANGDLESWTGGEPDGWQKIENISQESNTIHGGSYSAKHTSDQVTKDLQQDITGLQGGTEYNISFWYYDNDPEARTRIWSYWLEGTTTLPDNADELRPSTYSEDNSNWQQFTITLTAPAAADGFRFEVRVYKQDNVWGGSVFYDDFNLTGDIVINPEPSNYPTDFVADANGLSIDLSWTDSEGADLPDAYIIMAGITSNLPVPHDLTPIANDTDLSDGEGALNVPFGLEEAAFTNLDGNTTYYFTIYPYANGGANIDYKNDGTAPAANASTANFVIINSNNFNDNWGDWTPISVIGPQEWDRDNTYGPDGSACARVSGYEGSFVENEDWLISPALNFDNYDNEVIGFDNAKNYDGPDMELRVSTDYDGSGDPNSGTWTTLNYTLSGGSWAWVYSGDIDVSTYNGTEVYLALYFESTNSESATWEVDNIVISGEEDYIPDPEPTNYPTGFTAAEAGTAINLEWIDATGAQLPHKYIIFAGITSSLPVPADGQPVPNDTDLSDGEGALNVSYGTEEATFSALDPGATYYFSIYPYTNSGNLIDYKNDGTAPTAEATTSNTVPVVIESENFDANWGNWTTISVIGDQIWDRDNNYGPDGSPCAKMSGWDGQQSNDNEDWLISPSMNFDNYENEIIVFQNANEYSGLDMELKISTDYDGGGNPGSATWSNLSYTMSSGGFQYVSSGDIDLSGYDGNSVYVAFIFYSTSVESMTWEVDDIVISGEEEFVIKPEPSNYPVDFAADAAGTSVNVTWTDATGIQLPDKYIVLAGTESNLPVPQDGTPIPDDTDLSDGEGALNIAFGTEEAIFAGIDPQTTVYFVIYPYTNLGSYTDYKNDGTAPTANATTGNTITVVIESENF